jgi:hypothetical protein
MVRSLVLSVFRFATASEIGDVVTATRYTLCGSSRSMTMDASVMSSIGRVTEPVTCSPVNVVSAFTVSVLTMN